MKTITYTNDAGLKFTTTIDTLLEKIEPKGDSLYCVFFSYKVRDNGQGQTLMFIGKAEDALAYVFMFSVAHGAVDTFSAGGPNWVFVDSQNADNGSYDEVTILPLSRAYSHDGLRKVMADDFSYVCKNVLSTRKCRIN
ncbi:MAG: hypothetical protein EOM68_31385 [Spirochaetia bacterium]|nr:hypothetical protein [Spirochaetia bacterium]